MANFNPFIDLTDQNFGRWTVIRLANAPWNCRWATRKVQIANRR